MKYLKFTLTLTAILLFHFFLLINTMFTLWPEMVVYPYLLNNNFLLYRDIINPYTPLFIEFLAFFSKHFGYQPLPYQLLTWAIILLIDLLIFKFSYSLSKNFTKSIFATLFFAIFSVPLGINGLWFDLVQAPIIIVSIYFFYNNYKSKNTKYLMVSFFALAIAFFIKQQVIWIFLAYLIILFTTSGNKLKVKLKKVTLLLIPFVIFLLIQLLYFNSHGTQADFVYWSIYFPFVKSSGLPGYILLPNLKQIAVTTLIFLIFLPIFLEKKSSKILFVFCILLLMFTLPRFDYFHLIPAFSILAILSSSYKLNFKKKKQLYAISLICFLSSLVYVQRYFHRNWNNKVRFFEDNVQISASLLKFLGSPSPLYIQNGPDQIYPMSQTLPVKPWADEFPWYLEKTNLQNKILDSLVAQNPKFILYQPYGRSTKFDLGSYRPQIIADYLDSNYKDVQKITSDFVLKKKK